MIWLAEKLKCTTQTINCRIKKLINLGVIAGFDVEIDFSKLEYKLYRLDINLNEDVKKQPIIDLIVKNPHIKCVYGSIGDAADIELEFIIKDINQIHRLIENISLKFPNSIKEYKYHFSSNRHKSLPIPEI
jgi:DNA-binding Lrp family transcriptional regulator